MSTAEDEDLDGLEDWFRHAAGDPPLPSVRPTTEQVSQLLGQAGNAYSRGGRCPPFHLRRYVGYLLDAGISGDFVLNEILTHLPAESRLEDFHTLVRRQCGMLHRAKGDQRRLWRRVAESPAEAEHGSDEPSGRGDGDPSAKPAAAVPTKPGARADRLIEESLGDGRRVTATQFLAEARRRKIAPRTLAGHESGMA
jgi:hypothetical protein